MFALSVGNKNLSRIFFSFSIHNVILSSVLLVEKVHDPVILNTSSAGTPQVLDCSVQLYYGREH